MDDASRERLERLREHAGQLPREPVAGAELAAALVGTREASDALADARDRIDNALGLGAYEAAGRAASVLAEAFDDADTAVLLAETRLLGGDGSGARDTLAAVVGRWPEHAGARARLAAMAASEGDGAAALAWIEPVASHDADTAALYAQSLLAAGRLEEARDFGADAVARYPGSAVVHASLGLVLLGMGAPGDAVAPLSEALRLEPGRPEAYGNLAFALAMAGSRAAAFGVLDAAALRFPGDPGLAALREELRGD